MNKNNELPLDLPRSGAPRERALRDIVEVYYDLSISREVCILHASSIQKELARR